MAQIPDDVRELFTAANYAHVATLMPDGSPHSVPVWTGLEGDRVVFFTQTGSQKARNLERDPRVAISITDHDNPYCTARIRGRCHRRAADRCGAQARSGRIFQIDRRHAQPLAVG